MTKGGESFSHSDIISSVTAPESGKKIINRKKFQPKQLEQKELQEIGDVSLGMEQNNPFYGTEDNPGHKDYKEPKNLSDDETQKISSKFISRADKKILTSAEKHRDVGLTDVSAEATEVPDEEDDQQQSKAA